MYRCPEKFFLTILGRDLGIRGFFPLFFIPQSPNPGENFSGGLYNQNIVCKRICPVILIVLLLSGALACRLLPPAAAPLVAATLTAAPTLAPTSTPPPATPVIAPSPSPIAVSEDLTPYRSAMRPEFAGDVDKLAATGASRYDLEVRLEWPPANSGGEPRLAGSERIHYTNTETTPLAEIYFHLYPNLPGYGGQMQVESISVDGQAVRPEAAGKGAILRVMMPQPLDPGAAIDLALTYTVRVPSQAGHGYNIFSASDNTLALTGFYPAIAVYDEQGWNIGAPPSYGDATYLDTSLYQVKLTVPEALVVAASGTLLGSEANGDGSKTLSLASGPMRDFYLASRNDFLVAQTTVDGIVVNSYYPPQLEAGGRRALNFAAEALRVFNQRFGPYPYAEFDVVATPTTAGGVEYPGLVVIKQQLYDQENHFFEFTIAHEVAHQWWYGLVGNDQVDDPWLDEALTNYSAVFYWEAVKGPDQAQGLIQTLFFDSYEYAKQQGQDRAVIGPVADFSADEYGLIVYRKGPLFFNALRQEVGDEIYFKIMQTYFSEYKYKVVQPVDLMTVIENVSGRDVEPLVETWLQSRVVP